MDGNCRVLAPLMLAGWATFMLLAACGGGDSNAAPTARVGMAQTVGAGVTVVLSGAGSSDPDGSVVRYTWTQTSGPSVTLSNGTTAQPSFVAPSAAATVTLTFSLVVTDNHGAASTAAAVTVTVVPNSVPVANAGGPQTVTSGTTVTLNGSSSSDFNGSIAAYAWTQTSGPTVTLTGPQTAFPSFVSPAVGAPTVLTFSLTVTDNLGASSAASAVTVTVNPNTPPLANAGAAQAVNPGAFVSLDGTASSDADGTVTGYAWTQTAGTPITLSNAATSRPGFTAPMAAAGTVLTFSLVVTDNAGASSAPSTVAITIRQPPVANAGAPQTVNVGAGVTLDGSASTATGTFITNYSWTQLSGTHVVLSSAITSRPNFIAPLNTGALVFSLEVSDNNGQASAASTVTITVSPLTSGDTITGIVQFERVPFSTSAPFGLDYAHPVLRPSRGVRLQAYDTVTSKVLTGGVTDASGRYQLVVPANSNMRISVIASLQRDSTQALPRWDVSVQDDMPFGTTYSYGSPQFNSSIGTQNITIPTGISPSGDATTGSPTHARWSGPFAILDTIYTAMQTITAVAPDTTFPPLIVNWNDRTTGTFFSPSSAPYISLLADLTEDADEFDEHTVAHEYGHYIEFSFSRADNIGGSHALGDRLDPRVAFGEGFGYAFAGMVLNDPVVHDSYVDVGGIQKSAVFDMETNPPGAQGAGAGCWCSESSVYSILWDIYDNVPDANDNVALGFAPVWDILTSAQRTTPSVTSIFSFIAALVAARPADAPGINALVAAQNINPSGIDAFATSETNAPFPGMLPLFPSIAANGNAVVVRSLDDGGHYNKAGNSSFLRFTPSSSGLVRISVTTSNPAADADSDFIVYRSGVRILTAVDGLTRTQQGNLLADPNSTYIIEAYDCANGCSGTFGTPGDYDLTVTATPTN